MPAVTATPPRKPNRARFGIFVFLGVYPLVTLLLYSIIPLTQEWSIWQRNLVMVPLIVLCMVYFIIPTIHKRLHRWL